MKGRQLLILGGVLVALVIIGLVAKFAGTKEPGGLDEDILIEKFEPEKVAAIEFYHGASPAKKVLLEKKDSKWVVPAKHDAPADAKRIDEILKDLQGLGGEIRAREPSLFDQFEITQEQAIHLLLRGSSGSEMLHLLIGKSGGDWNSSFARKAGSNTIFVVDKPLLSRLGINQPKSGQLSGIDEMRWVDLLILPEFKWEKVTTLDLRSPRTELSFERVQSEKKEEKAKPGQETPSWKVTTSGIDYAADDKGIKSLLQGLGMRRADDIADPAKEEEYGFEQATHAATLTFEDKSSKKILIGKMTEKEGRKQYYLKVEGSRLPFMVAGYIVDRLFEHAGKLLAMNVLDIPEKEIKSIAVQAPETEVVIEREGAGKWRVARPELDFEEREGTAKQMADKVRVFKPDDLYNRGEAAFPEEAEYVVILELKDGKTRKIEFSAETEGTDGSRYARVDGVESVFGVSRNTFDRLCPRATRLLNIILVDVQRQHLRTIEVAREKQKFILRRDAKQEWHLDAYGISYNADLEKTSTIRDSFTEIRPDNFIGRADFAQYGLDKPILTVKSKGRGEATVIVGKKDESGKKYYAAEVESGTIFKMTEEDVKAAQIKLSQLATLRIFPAKGKPDFLKVRGAIAEMVANLEARLEEREKEGKKVSIWVTPEGKELDTSQVRRLISKVRALLATDISTGSLMRGKPEEISLGLDGEKHYLSLDLIKYAEEEMYRCQYGHGKGLLLVRESLLKPIFELAARIVGPPEIKEPEKEEERHKEKAPPEQGIEKPEGKGK